MVGIAARFLHQFSCGHDQPLQPGQRCAQPLPRKLQLAAVVRLQAQHPVGERVKPAIDQRLQDQEIAAGLAHLPAPVDQEIVVHPDVCAALF